MNIIHKNLKKALLVLVVILFMSLLNVHQVNGLEHRESQEMSGLLPQFESYKWIYHGFVEYGHTMKLHSIKHSDKYECYSIEGSVHDPSEGEADKDFSLIIKYIVKPDSIIQLKEGEAMIDSQFNRIEIIREPLEKGTTWTQEVIDEHRNIRELESSIIDVEKHNGLRVFTIIYNDKNSHYYEKRKVREDTGVIYFERLMFGETENYRVHYNLNKGALDTRNSFKDIDNKDNIEYISKLKELGVIQGYTDTTFRPNASVTKAEFLKLLIKILGYKLDDGIDVWYDPYVKKAIELDIIIDNEFQDYNLPIKYNEIRDILKSSMDIGPENIESIIKGNKEELNIDEPVTREEAARIFYQVSNRLDISFSLSKAMEIEKELERRLYQDTIKSDGLGLNRVKDFNNKDDLVNYLGDIICESLAKKYVNNFYEERDSGLFLIPMDGITKISEDSPVILEQKNPRKYLLRQKNYSDLIGNEYILLITYEYNNRNWIITERDIDVLKQ